MSSVRSKKSSSEIVADRASDGSYELHERENTQNDSINTKNVTHEEGLKKRVLIFAAFTGIILGGSFLLLQTDDGSSENSVTIIEPVRDDNFQGFVAPSVEEHTPVPTREAQHSIDTGVANIEEQNFVVDSEPSVIIPSITTQLPPETELPTRPQYSGRPDPATLRRIPNIRTQENLRAPRRLQGLNNRRVMEIQAETDEYDEYDEYDELEAFYEESGQIERPFEDEFDEEEFDDDNNY